MPPAPAAPCAETNIFTIRDQQEGAETVQDSVEAGHQQDHEGAQEDGPQNALGQHPLLPFQGNAEVTEQHQPHEHLVDGQGLLIR